MVNECKVLYKGDKGIMTFDMKKTIFLHRNCTEEVKEGLGVIVDGTLVDKGNYAFAVFKNVSSVIPKNYATLDFFNNKGIPLSIYKGYYGDNILVKEVYKDLSFIRAYAEDGRVLLYESNTIKNEAYEGPNMYFTRIDSLVEEWVDITSEIEEKVLADLRAKKAKLSLDNEFVLGALRGLSRNDILKLESGLLVADGKFESLILWGDDTEVKMAWLGRKLDLTQFKCTPINAELAAIIKEIRDREVQ